MSDIFLIELIKTLFWLTVLMFIMCLFRNELKSMLQSIGSLKIGNTNFDFKDKRETIKSHIMLAEILISILTRPESILHIETLLTPMQFEQLNTFARKYIKDSKNDEINEQLLQNIGYLIMRSGRYNQAITIFDLLLKRSPNHLELLNLRGLAFLTSRMPENITQSEIIFAALVARYPENSMVRINLALAKSQLNKHAEAIKEMRIAIDLGFWRQNPNMLEDPLFHITRTLHTSDFSELQIHLQKHVMTQ